jgi:hypothetical protein
MHWRASVALVLGAAMAVPACSLLVDTSGLSGNDGAADAADTGPPADASEAATRDADALDATSDADGDAGFSCPQGSGIFCDDFDHDALGARWTSTDKSGATLVLEDGGVTPPNALRAEVLGGPNAYANLIARFPGTPAGHVRCELDMELPASPPLGEIDVLVLATRRVGPTPSSYQVYLQHLDTGWALGEFGIIADGGTVDHNTEISDLPIGSWMHLVSRRTEARSR